MKTIKTLGLIAACILSSFSIKAQQGMVFDKIRVSGSTNVELKQGEKPAITVDGQDVSRSMQNYASVTNDGWLVITESSKKLVVTATNLTRVDISGAGKLESNGVFKTSDVDLRVTGTGKMDLNLDADKVTCVISGTGKIELEGTANDMNIDISGAGKIDGENFKVKNCTANISGSGKCLVDVTDELTSNISGTGSVYYVTKPTTLNNNISGVGRVGDANAIEKDTTRITFGKKKVLIINGEGSSVRIGFKDSVNITPDKVKSHWVGFEMGINTLVDQNFSTTPPSGYDFLKPRIEKSIALNFNLVDAEIKLYQRNIMLVTGFGFSINNYRFKSDAYLAPGVDSIVAISDPDVSLTKNKLVAEYINVPLLIEFNTSENPKRTFHLATGVIGGFRVASHLKLIKSSNGDAAKVKIYDDFNLNPFRCDATVRLGYGNFTMFGSYGLLNMFKGNRGPDMVPFTAGIRFAGW